MEASSATARIVEYETISGEQCTIIECVYTESLKSKIWIALDKGYVLKMENITSEGSTIMEYTDIDLESAIPDSQFEFPAGVQIQEIS